MNKKRISRDSKYILKNLIEIFITINIAEKDKLRNISAKL